MGQQFLPKARFTANTAASSAVSHKFNPYVIIPKNADVRVRAKSSSANAIPEVAKTIIITAITTNSFFINSSFFINKLSKALVLEQ